MSTNGNINFEIVGGCDWFIVTTTQLFSKFSIMKNRKEISVLSIFKNGYIEFK